MKNIRRMCAMLLVLAMVLAIMPVSGAATEETKRTETKAPEVIPESAYAQADAVFAEIDAVEAQLATKNASQADVSKAAAEVVKASDSYVEDSLEFNGEAFSWWTDGGIRCMYSPRMEKIQREMVPAETGAQDLIVNEPVEAKDGRPSGNQVYLIGPYYGYDENFTDQYKNEATRIAQALGDTDGYTLYSGNAATVDKVATAVSKGAVVIFDSHGCTDYSSSSSDDCVTGATNSYLCLNTASGLTDMDYADGAGYLVSGGAAINGETIANHMTQNSPGGLVWMAICLSMATDTLANPMRRMGVEVACGYSQSVTFGGEYLYEEAFWDKMLEGKTVAEANAYMKSVWGDWDCSSQIGNYYNWPSSYIAYSLTEARNEWCAFPIVVSDEDSHPGQRNNSGFYGADTRQTVQSTYTLINSGVCGHTYDNACDTTCNSCGEVRPVNGHSYLYTSVDGTTHLCTCNYCGYAYQEAHRWQGGEVGASGMREYTCIDCGALRTESADPSGQWITGDLNGDEIVNETDAIYLLQYVLMPQNFPVNQPVDFDGNGRVDEMDAIYLLQYVLWPELFPLGVEEYGEIRGTVASANDRTNYIENAKIDIRKQSTLERQATVYSDAQGEYSAYVPGDTYKVKISASGYIPFESLETVQPGQSIYLETYLLVEGNEEDNLTGNIGGLITNSVTGGGISGVSLTVRKGWNILSGEVISTTTTGSDGSYSLNLPLGNYTIAMERDGFVPGHFNVAVTQIDNYNCHGVMTPDSTGSVELGDMRIILTWGATPSDLDSHLWGPTVDGSSSYHIFYSNMSYYDGNTRMAFLDVDDTTSYGPETTTVYDMTNNGTYSFYVHDYTNRNSSSSTAMSNSGAKVQVYIGEELIAQYNVPTSRVGTVWHVFDFDATTGRITSVNAFSNISSPTSVGYRNNSVTAVIPAKDEKEKY